jgi:hypothetical protein
MLIKVYFPRFDTPKETNYSGVGLRGHTRQTLLAVSRPIFLVLDPHFHIILTNKIDYLSTSPYQLIHID